MAMVLALGNQGGLSLGKLWPWAAMAVIIVSAVAVTWPWSCPWRGPGQRCGHLLLPVLLLKFQLMSSAQKRRTFAKTAPPKISIYDVTRDITLVLDCHGGPMR